MRIILRVCCLHPRHCALHTHSYPYTPPHSRIQTVSLLRRTNDVPTTCVLRKYEVPYTEAGGSEGSNESGGADGDEELPASVRTASAGLRRTRDSGGPGCSGPSIPAAAVSFCRALSESGRRSSLAACAMNLRLSKCASIAVL
jgi:hypothetical protein